jgi:hypothetical protein
VYFKKFTIMQHQVHVLSVFDRISFKYWLFVPQTGLTQRQDNSVLPLQVIVLLNSFCSTILIFFGLLILALEFQLPFHFQILQGKVIFIKVQINCQSLTNWVGLLYAPGIGKSDLCCYCLTTICAISAYHH